MFKQLVPALLPLALLAQPSPEPRFLVASVKQTTFTGRPELLQENGDTLACTCRLNAILQRAYDVPLANMVVPGWFRDQFYEIAAKLPPGAAKDQIPAMLRDLLEERFHISMRREQRATDIYALRIDPEGLKAKPAPPDAPANLLTDSLAFDRFARLHINGKMSLTHLATILNGNMDRGVLDQTGAAGNFEILLDVRVPKVIPSGIEVPQELTTLTGKKIAGDAPMIFTEIRKLGLVLEPVKAPLDFVVVDRIDRVPTEN